MFIENESLSCTKIGLRQRETLAKWLSIWGREALSMSTLQND
jgi:hypothetical protein